MPISDAQYRAVRAVVQRWDQHPQPSYQLDQHNCVIFVKEIAQAVGLTASDDQKFVRNPSEFLDDLEQRNASLIAQANAPVPPMTVVGAQPVQAPAPPAASSAAR